MTTKFPAFITKFALSTGIHEIEVEDCFETDPDMVRSRNAFYFKGEWWRTREEAIVKAEDMRTRRIASLRKQIAKLEGMKFA